MDEKNNGNSFDSLKKFLRYKKSNLDAKNVELRLAQGTTGLYKNSSPPRVES